MNVSPDQFEFVRRLLEEQVGMVLEADQNLFVASRLLPVAQRHGWSDLEPLFSRLHQKNDRLLVQELIESLVTHETSFFRDMHYFDELSEHVLPRLIASRSSERRLSIWCAACSTGQEPYSLAMILRERFSEQLRDWQVDLLATDVSAYAIEQARTGLYSDTEIRRGLSSARLTQHFRCDQSGWHINDRLRTMVRFRQMNLIGTWPQVSAIDLVLLRNVLIYLTPASRQSILSRMQNTLRPDGCLMLGSTEISNDPRCLHRRSP